MQCYTTFLLLCWLISHAMPRMVECCLRTEYAAAKRMFTPFFFFLLSDSVPSKGFLHSHALRFVFVHYFGMGKYALGILLLNLLLLHSALYTAEIINAKHSVINSRPNKFVCRMRLCIFVSLVVRLWADSGN